MARTWRVRNCELMKDRNHRNQAHGDSPWGQKLSWCCRVREKSSHSLFSGVTVNKQPCTRISRIPKDEVSTYCLNYFIYSYNAMRFWGFSFLRSTNFIASLVKILLRKLWIFPIKYTWKWSKICRHSQNFSIICCCLPALFNSHIHRKNNFFPEKHWLCHTLSHECRMRKCSSS